MTPAAPRLAGTTLSTGTGGTQTLNARPPPGCRTVRGTLRALAVTMLPVRGAGRTILLADGRGSVARPAEAAAWVQVVGLWPAKP
jgi:hypothetical protein